MEVNIKSIVLFSALVTTALTAGLFYAWVVSVIPGTKRIPDQALLEVMQSINRAILHPAFFIIFFGALFLLFAQTYFQFKIKLDNIFWLTLSATLIYLIGTMGVTMFGNVPLNNIVETMDLSKMNLEEFKEARLNFEERWNQLNMIRTVASFISFLLLLFATLIPRL